MGLVRADLGLVSLSVINEGRDVDEWYREFNDQAWGPARVAAIAFEIHGELGLRAFYSTFGTLRHVEKRRDAALLSDAVAKSGIGSDLLAAAEGAEVDASLREWTTMAIEPVRADVGTPITHMGAAAFFGPVLTAVPRGDAAAKLFAALMTLAETPAFVEFKRGRIPTLEVG